jgi:hypothetical protein
LKMSCACDDASTSFRRAAGRHRRHARECGTSPTPRIGAIAERGGSWRDSRRACDRSRPRSIDASETCQAKSTRKIDNQFARRDALRVAWRSSARSRAGGARGAGRAIRSCPSGSVARHERGRTRACGPSRLSSVRTESARSALA